MLRTLSIGQTLAVCFLMAAGCNEPEPGNSQPDQSLSHVQPLDGNLIENGSFEIDDKPTLQGWRFGNPDLARLVGDAPEDGGNWSLELTSDWSPTSGFAYTSVANTQSGDIVSVSSYVRAVGIGGGGILELRVGPSVSGPFSGPAIKQAVSTNTAWTRISLTETLTPGPGDSLWVVLSSFDTEIMERKALFDMVKVEKTNTE